ncbi:MAG: hypothetical protein RLZ79_2112, partial [Pseudomonadota bacterium]
SPERIFDALTATAQLRRLQGASTRVER